MPLFRRATPWLFAHTAIGEVVLRGYWRLFVPDRRPAAGSGSPDDARYSIPGGRNFRQNADAFGRRFATTDGIVLTREFSGEAQRLFDLYVFALEEFVRICRDNDAAVVFVYFPSYSQVYDPSIPTTIQTALRKESQRLSMPFLDLTQALRSHGANRVLHLAPVDYHPNPAGNEVIAGAIFTFLREQGLVQ